MAIRNRDDDAATVFHPDVAFFRLTDGDVRPVPVGPHASDDTAGEGAVSAVVKNKGGNLVLPVGSIKVKRHWSRCRGLCLYGLTFNRP